MKARKTVHLALAPEGTRKPVKRWKTGFHTIAREVGCPVYMGYFDWGTKRISRGHKVELTDDARADMERIQKLYEDMHLVGKHPEMYITK
jgi:1-acyl-sn-glycerol-3-phosphate acyltransferase